MNKSRISEFLRGWWESFCKLLPILGIIIITICLFAFPVVVFFTLCEILSVWFGVAIAAICAAILALVSGAVIFSAIVSYVGLW